MRAELRRLIDAKEEGTAALDGGLFLRYRPPATEGDAHHLSVSRKDGQPTLKELEQLKKTLEGVTAVNNLATTGPHLQPPYCIYRLSWYDRPLQPGLFSA